MLNIFKHFNQHSTKIKTKCLQKSGILKKKIKNKLFDIDINQMKQKNINIFKKYKNISNKHFIKKSREYDGVNNTDRS